MGWQGWFVRLREAVRTGDQATVADLLRRRGVDRRDEKGRTLLYLAASRPNAEIVRLLLSAGADPNAVTCFGETPYFTALSRTFTTPDVITLLRDHGADSPTPLMPTGAIRSSTVSLKR